MSILEYSQSYEDIHHAICERVQHAKRKHPNEPGFIERLNTIHLELEEVYAELMRGDYARAIDEYKDVGATLYRAMDELSKAKGVKVK